MNSSKNVTRKVSGPEFSSEVGYEGWTCIGRRVSVPEDYNNKKVISKDDVLNLSIELNILKNWDEFYRSPVLFAQHYTAVDR
jgi:hypothetical protein